MLDIPNETIKKILEFFVEMIGEESMKSIFSINFDTNEIPRFLLTPFNTEQKLKLAEIINDKDLIKNISNAEAIGNIIFSDYDLLDKRTDFIAKLEQILSWIK